jgi:hypothetical protein
MSCACVCVCARVDISHRSFDTYTTVCVHMHTHISAACLSKAAVFASAIQTAAHSIHLLSQVDRFNSL